MKPSSGHVEPTPKPDEFMNQETKGVIIIPQVQPTERVNDMNN